VVLMVKKFGTAATNLPLLILLSVLIVLASNLVGIQGAVRSC